MKALIAIAVLALAACSSGITGTVGNLDPVKGPSPGFGGGGVVVGPSPCTVCGNGGGSNTTGSTGTHGNTTGSTGTH